VHETLDSAKAGFCRVRVWLYDKGMDLERTPDGALRESPPDAKCFCGCGGSIDLRNYVRMNGEEFYLPGHEMRKDEKERSGNKEQFGENYVPDWKLDKDAE